MCAIRRGQLELRRVIILLFCPLILLGSVSPLAAQTRATAVPAILHSPTPLNAPAIAPTVTAAPSPTPAPAARLQALQSAGNVNVRPRPDIDSDVLGTITYGTEYAVLRQYFRWYELRYSLAPSGRAWVYGDLVEITGDATSIEVVEDLAELEVIDSALAALEGEADERTIELSPQAIELDIASPLPTFTPPPLTPVFFSGQEDRPNSSDAPWTNLPPLAPILVLAGLGFVGLLISLLRG